MPDAEPGRPVPALPPHLRLLAVAIGALTALLGLTTIAGWLLDIPRLVQVHPSVAPMVFNTAVCFLLTGASLLALAFGSRLGSRGAGGIVAAVAALTLVGYLTTAHLPNGPRPERMAPNTAAAFLLVGLGLAFAGRGAQQARAFAAGGAAGIVALSLSIVALVGYVFRIQPAFGWGRMVAMSPQSAVGLAAAGFAVVCVVGRIDLTAGRQRMRWLAFLVGAAGATSTLLLWQALAADHDNALRGRVGEEAQAVQRAVTLRLQLHADAAMRLAHRWQDLAAPLREEWEDDAGTHVRDFAGTQSIAWVETDGAVRWVVPVAGNERLIGTRLDSVPPDGGGTLAVRAEPAPGPGAFLFLVAPLRTLDAPRGSFFTKIQGARLLDAVLAEDARSTHRISLTMAGEPVGLAGASSSPSPSLQCRNEWALLGQHWSVQVTPSEAWVAEQRSPLPLGALCLGLFFSGLLAWSVLKTGEARLTILALRESDMALRREAAERRVAELERDRFFSLSIDMLCISNADGYFKRLNPAFERTLGFTVAELQASPFADFVHPDDLARTLAEVQHQVARGLSTMHFENRYRCKDGSYRWLAWKSTPDVETGMMYALARDVTHEKQAAQRLEASEERYRGLVEAATDIIYRTDRAGRFEFVNAVAVRVMGYSQQKLLGMHFTELIRPDQRETVRAWYERQWRKRMPLTRHECPVVARDGQVLWIEQTVQRVMEDGRLVAFQGIARDITERKSMEAERERLIAELQATITQVRTLSEMLPMCSGCRRIRDDDDGSWHQLEKYLTKTQSGTQVSHGICPECTRELYPDYARRKEAREQEGKN